MLRLCAPATGSFGLRSYAWLVRDAVNCTLLQSPEFARVSAPLGWKLSRYMSLLPSFLLLIQRRLSVLWTITLALLLLITPPAQSAQADEFRDHIKPLLETYCFDCHADGAKKGEVAFDQHASDTALLADKELWWRVLKNVRTGLMPPRDKKQPTPEQRDQLGKWIKRGAFALNPDQPDPGRVTLRRLNRVEYRNTIRDLTGVDFRTDEEFPPDDTGHGFDNIGDVLTLPTMLLEKYLAAAQVVVGQAASGNQRSRWFVRETPTSAPERLAYAREILTKFATQAFRRPVDEETLARLVKLAEITYSQPDKSFDQGIVRSLEAVLASPRFLFREEAVEPPAPGQAHPYLDDYSLASRLSYLLWSTMPDDELLNLAAEKKLRINLAAQFTRMFADERSKSFLRNFTGQWLQVRDIEGIPIDPRFVLLREQKPDPELDAARKRFFELRRRDAAELSPEEKAELERGRELFRRRSDRFKDVEFGGRLRRDLRRETEMYFEYLLRENRPLTELVESDYTFLNAQLAKHYGLPAVEGDELRRVILPPDSPRGGILTQGAILTVTSNPTRTSPVKRGQFILDNILGMPAPPPPANVPPLEDFSRGRGFEGTLRENLARHREDPKCASCHNRMDPLGISLENFNAMGQWRVYERGKPVDAGGELVSGERFTTPQELKRILATNHRAALYRCFTEKLLTYALGRGLDWRDEATIDQILANVEKSGGKARDVLSAIVESDAFLKRHTGQPAQQ